MRQEPSYTTTSTCSLLPVIYIVRWTGRCHCRDNRMYCLLDRSALQGWSAHSEIAQSLEWPQSGQYLLWRWNQHGQDLSYNEIWMVRINKIVNRYSKIKSLVWDNMDINNQWVSGLNQQKWASGATLTHENGKYETSLIWSILTLELVDSLLKLCIPWFSGIQSGVQYPDAIIQFHHDTKEVVILMKNVRVLCACGAPECKA